MIGIKILKTGIPATRDSRGVALLMVLWVITILSVVVLEFCFAMRTEVKITQNYQQQLQAYAAAQGSVQRAIAELILKHDPRIQQLRKTAKEEEIAPENKEWVTDGREYRIAFEGTEAGVRVSMLRPRFRWSSISADLLSNALWRASISISVKPVSSFPRMLAPSSESQRWMPGVENQRRRLLV